MSHHAWKPNSGWVENLYSEEPEDAQEFAQLAANSKRCKNHFLHLNYMRVLRCWLHRRLLATKKVAYAHAQSKVSQKMLLITLLTRLQCSLHCFKTKVLTKKNNCIKLLKWRGKGETYCWDVQQIEQMRVFDEEVLISLKNCWTVGTAGKWVQ